MPTKYIVKSYKFIFYNLIFIALYDNILKTEILKLRVSYLKYGKFFYCSKNTENLYSPIK